MFFSNKMNIKRIKFEKVIRIYNSKLTNSEKGWQKSFYIYSKWYAN